MSETVDGPVEHLMLAEFAAREQDVIRAVAKSGHARWGQGAVVSDGVTTAFMPVNALAAELADFPDLLTALLARIEVCSPDQAVLLVSSPVAGGVRGNSWLAEIPLTV